MNIIRNYSSSAFSRREFVGTLGALSLAACSSTNIRKTLKEDAAQSDTKGYLLLDQSIVAQTYAMRREISNPEPVREGPLLKNAWAYGSVFREPDGQFRMWYLAPPIYCEYYATSWDGLNWELPNFNLVNPKYKVGPNAFLHLEQRDKNGRLLVGTAGPEGFCVLDAQKQPHPCAKARYTALYLANVGKEGECGFCIAYSDDGIHWFAGGHNPVVRGWMDTSNCLLYDPQRKVYRTYGRPPLYVELSREVNRMLCCMESHDLIHWSSPRTVLNTDERDADGFHLTDEAQLKDTPGDRPCIRGRDKQFYGMNVFISHGLYIGFAQMYDIPSGDTWLELCHSLDGLQWFREPLRKPIIGPRPGTWESRQVRPTMGTPPVQVEDRQWIYYSASTRSHSGKGKAAGGPSIGCRSIRTDRWCGYRSIDIEAELLTHPFKVGSDIFLNAETKPDGWIEAALIDEYGNPIKGFARADCIPIKTDALRQPIRWKDNPRLPSGQMVRLRLFNQNASIYAFYT